MNVRRVKSTIELLYALAGHDCSEIVVECDLEDVPSIKLRPGQSLHAEGDKPFMLKFIAGIDGICCTRDNTITQLDIRVSREFRAIYNDTSCDTLGELNLHNLTTLGSVHIVAREELKHGTLRISKLHVLDADSTNRRERPHAYGVDVIQGAFTLWNMQRNEGSSLRATLDQISVGEIDSPVSGTGIFICGSQDQETNVEVDHLRTGSIYSNGGIPDGVPNVISGGVLVLYGAHVESIENLGPVETLGNNDMALDNWGSVGTWLARGPVTTRRPSAIGFVNFGTLAHLRMESIVETFGTGARGFNVYSGTVDRADFERIVTHGDGAVGIQISQPVGEIHVNNGIETFGATGPSLVKGVITQLSAIPVSIKSGGHIKELVVYGGVKTHNASITPLELQGSVEKLIIVDGVRAIDVSGDK